MYYIIINHNNEISVVKKEKREQVNEYVEIYMQIHSDLYNRGHYCSTEHRDSNGDITYTDVITYGDKMVEINVTKGLD